MLRLSLLALTVSTQGNAPSEPVWRWDRDVSICVLKQQLPDGGTLEISRTPGSNSTGVTVSVASLTKMAEADAAKGVIRLEPGGEIAADVFQQATPDEHHLRISAGTEEQVFMTRLASASALEIAGKGIRSVPVTLRSAAAAVQALRTCEDKKMREWGLDPIALDSLRARPRPLDPLSKRISTEDYPRLALAHLLQGDSVIRLDVSQDGRVKSCKSLNPSPYRGFEYATCDLMLGAKFEPAVDAAGNRVPAPYVFEIRFQIWERSH